MQKNIAYIPCLNIKWIGWLSKPAIKKKVFTCHKIQNSGLGQQGYKRKFSYKSKITLMHFV